MPRGPLADYLRDLADGVETITGEASSVVSAFASMRRSEGKPISGQRGLRTAPLYTFPSAVMGSYANTYSTGVQRIVQEVGIPFIEVEYLGAFGECRLQLLLEDGSTVIAAQTVTNAGQTGAVQSTKLTPFDGDAVTKKARIVFQNLSDGVRNTSAGAASRARLQFNVNSDFQITTFKLVAVKYGYLNSRHAKLSDNALGLGLRMVSLRDSYTSALWIRDVSTDSFKQRIDAAVAIGAQCLRVPVWFKHCVDSSNTLVPSQIAKVRDILDYCVTKGVTVIANLNFPTGANYGTTGIGSYPETVVYYDQLGTSGARQALADRAGVMVAEIAKHRAVKLIEIQNEANLMLRSDAPIQTEWLDILDYLQKVNAAVKANSNLPTSVSFSGASGHVGASFVSIGCDVLDHHVYGNSLYLWCPSSDILISGECELLADLQMQQAFCQTFGPWHRFTDPTQGTDYHADMVAGFTTSWAGKNLLTIPTFTGVFAESSLGLSTTLANSPDVRVVRTWNMPTSGEPMEWRRNSSGSWIAVNAP